MSDRVLSSNEVELDVRSFMRSILRKLPFILVVVALVFAATYVFLGTLDPRFVSETTILIERRETGLTRPTQGQESTGSILDQEAIASQVQLIRSRELAAKVADKLDLASRAEFDPARETSMIDDLLSRYGLGGEEEPGAPLEDRVLDRYFKKLDVYAIERSRVISINFTSFDPELAAAAANAIAEEYLLEQSATKRDSTADAAEWLSLQIVDLRDRVQEAEARVEAFRAENDLFSAGGVAGGTLSQQQLSGLNAQLATVRTQKADAEARALRIRAALDAGITPNQNEVLSSQLIQRLVEQQVGLRAQIAQLSATLLPQHPQMQALQAQVSDLDRQIAAEARKILAAIEAEAELAGARETALNAELGRLKAATAAANGAEVELRALEREAAAQRDLLDSYLRRYREALAREQVDLLPADARVISRAAVPFTPVFPRKIPLSAAAGAAALLLILGIAMLRELASGRSLRAVAVPEAPPLAPDVLPVDGHKRWADDRGVRRIMPDDPTMAHGVSDGVEKSLSAIVETIAGSDYPRVLVTLAEGSDEAGRPLAAVALARALSKSDKRTVLVDLRGDGADSVSMGEESGLPGVTELVTGEVSFAQAIFRDRKSRVHFVPSGKGEVDAEALSAGRLDTMLSALTMTYDTVVLDAEDDLIAELAPDCKVAVVVSEFQAADPRTVKAFERVSAVSEAQILLLVVDPAPPGDAAEPAEEDQPEAAA